MFDLFRFVVLRPPEKQDSDSSISSDSETKFLKALRQARAGTAPATKLRRISDEFVQSDEFVTDVTKLTVSRQLESLHAGLDELLAATDRPIDLRTLSELARTAFGAAAPKTVASLADDYRRLYDSVVATKLASSAPAVGPLQLYLRLIDLVRRIAKEDESLEQQAGLRNALERSIVLPSTLLPLPLPQADEEPPPLDEEPPARARQLELTERHELLTEAHRFLNTLAPADFASIAQPTAQERRASPKIDNEALLDGIQEIQSMLASKNASADGRTHGLDLGLARGGSKASLTPQAVERLSRASRSALSDLGIDLTTASLAQAVQRTAAEIVNLRSELAPSEKGYQVALLGNQLYPSSTLQGFQIGRPKPLKGGHAWPVLPSTHGSVKPVGVGDLLVVKQQLIAYETGEVAYIENILKGESHKREVSRSELTEESIQTDQETVKEEERDLQTAERFEMRRESESVVNLDGRLKGNGNFQSPGYGGVVEFDNNNESQLQGSQQTSERTASTYGKDVTSRATSKITERVRTQVMRRTLRQFSEKTEHSFENTDGDDHVIGVYQWVDKVYEGQVYNYGKRLFYDIVVPEPAAFLIQALAQRETEGRALIKPDPFILGADQIDELNYTALAQRYGATGIEPPPALYKTVSKSYAEVDPASMMIAKKEEITFSGYKAVGYGWATRTARPISQINPEVLQVLLGTADMTANVGLNGETDSISVSIMGINVSHLLVAVNLLLERTDWTYRSWQGRAHSAIGQAYQKRLAEYEERLANLRAVLRTSVIGQSSDRKRELEKVELKRSCISIFTAQDYSIFNGIEFSNVLDPMTGLPLRYPQVNLTAAETQGRYIRFFEQAFEWEQMTYQFYPYFWSRKEHWLTKAMIEDADKQFQEFLKTGAARVLVPVRPGFEQALLHFMETGEIWQGGEPPQINSESYLPLIEETKAANQAAGKEVPYGAPWKFRLPTALVKLRKDGELPIWKKLASGEWVPDA